MRRKTAAQHRADGTYRPHRHGKGSLPVGIPDTPRDLPTPIEATWRTLTRELEAAGILAEIDGPVLRRMCELHWIATEAFDEVRRLGLTVQHTNKAGETNDVQNPSVRTYLAAVKELNGLAHRFGMTPTGRLGMSFDERPVEDDPAAKHFDDEFAVRGPGGVTTRNRNYRGPRPEGRE